MVASRDLNCGLIEVGGGGLPFSSQSWPTFPVTQCQTHIPCHAMPELDLHFSPGPTFSVHCQFLIFRPSTIILSVIFRRGKLVHYVPPISKLTLVLESKPSAIIPSQKWLHCRVSNTWSSRFL